MGGLVTECAVVQWLPPVLRHTGGETGDIEPDCPLQRERVGCRGTLGDGGKSL